MNFVADEGVDAPIVQRLRADGHSILYIAEIWPGVADEQVLALAIDNQAVLITADKDFGALVFQQRRVVGCHLASPRWFDRRPKNDPGQSYHCPLRE